MRFSYKSRARLIVAECRPDLRAQARTLLRLAVEADAQGNGLKDGAVIEYGWAPLRVKAEDRDLLLCEPNYAGDPNEFVPTVDGTLHVLAGQTALLHGLGIEGVAAKYNQGVVLKRGVLQIPHIYLHRRSPVNEHDSGWYIGPADEGNRPPPDSELESTYVFSLLAPRPSLLQAMALPYEYLAVFDGDKIEVVLDPGGKTVWPRREQAEPA